MASESAHTQPNHPLLQSLQVGPVQIHGTPGSPDRWDQPWTSGFCKEAVAGPIWLGRTNLVGDQQHFHQHGGPDKAVLAYSADHYALWRRELGRQDMGPGGFGENFTVERLSEETVCIGDRFAVGEAVVEVAQPRIPCHNIARRWHMPHLPKLVEQTGRTGWYLRVLHEGHVEAGRPMILQERPFPRWTVARVSRTRRQRRVRPEDAALLARVPALAESFRALLT